MPYSYRIDKERQLVISTASGRVTCAEVQAHQDRLRSDPDLNPDFNRLIDTSEVTLADLSTDEIKSIVSPHRLFFSLKSRAALVAPTPHVFGVARMLAAYLEVARPAQFRVFRDFASAMNWLDLPVDTDLKADHGKTLKETR